MTAEDEGHPDVIEVPAGYDLSVLEVVVARLTSDGIESRIEPLDLGMVPDDSGGYRLLLRRDDLDAVLPVLLAAGIELPDEATD